MEPRKGAEGPHAPRSHIVNIERRKDEEEMGT